MRRNGSRIMREELMLSREHGTHLCMQEEIQTFFTPTTKDFYLSSSHQENPNTSKNLITQGNNTREGTMGYCSLSTENM
jgi:hypothetical protein